MLVVTGTAASDRIALRLSATDRQILELDVGDNGSADVRVARERFRRIRVDAPRGDDRVRIDEANGVPGGARPVRAPEDVRRDLLRPSDTKNVVRLQGSGLVLVTRG